MVACSMFQTGQYLKAFTFNPTTFVITNHFSRQLPEVGVGDHTVFYHTLFNDFDNWLTAHADNSTLYYDGPKFSGDENYIFLNGRRTHVNDLNEDTRQYIRVILRHQRHHQMNTEYRDTHIKTVRKSVKDGKPALECLLLSDNTNEVRMSFAVMRDHYSQQRTNKISYQQTLAQLDLEPSWVSIKEFISLMLPQSQRNRLGLKTLKNARKNWAKTSGEYFNKKELLRNTNNSLFNTFEDLYQRSA